jgi:peptidoglycan/LPS O-acetylase OafA/YrhL
MSAILSVVGHDVPLFTPGLGVIRGIPDERSSGKMVRAVVQKYRPDVDGLRAIAVSAVVLFHFQIPPFFGGYVGVDVFFVISGYLITSMILPEIGGHRFSLVTFYERRVRRIFPALFVVLIACVFCGALLLLPHGLKDLHESVAAATLFASNFLFWHKSGYFDAPAHDRPLLHTWSLSVEEQFYVFFPLFLWLVATRVPRYLNSSMLCVAVGSFLISIYQVHFAPVSAFYLIPSRAWELLLGAGLAVGMVPGTASQRVCNAAVLTGLILIVASTLLYSRETPFPGLSAIPACFGTLLVIWAGEDRASVMSRILSWKPVVFVGLASYSFYLWHWPIFVFSKFYLVRNLTAIESALLIALSFALAAASLLLIERPFRRRNGLITRRQIFSVSAVTMAGLVGIGVFGYLAEGWPGRFPVDMQSLIAGRVNEDDEKYYCAQKLRAADVRSGQLCRLGATDGRHPAIIVWGDSQANALAPLFHRLAEQSGVSIQMATSAGCPPLLGVSVASLSLDYDCHQLNEAVIDAIESMDVPIVVLVSRFSAYALGWDKDDMVEGSVQPYLSDYRADGSSRAASKQVFQRGIERTLLRLAKGDRAVWIVQEVPNLLVNGPEALVRAALTHRDVSLFELSLAHHRDRSSFVNDVLDALMTKVPFRRIDPATMLCDDARCHLQEDGRSLYSDNNHLSAYGAVSLLPLFMPITDSVPASLRAFRRAAP